MPNRPPEHETASNGGQPIHCVVGSGPTGVACAQALLERGARVRLLDGGVGLEASRAEAIAQLRRGSPELWTGEQLALLKEGTKASSKGIPLKRIYGSDYPYRECELHAPADYLGVGLRPSLGRGGLSTVWGAAMLPYLDRDLDDWPLRLADLEPHYAAVVKLTGLSARHDGLETRFRLYAEAPRALELSRQAKALLARLERHRTPLATAGVSFGQARLAVAAPGPSGSAGCIYCGLCMYGCPYEYIYHSGDTLDRLRQHPRFSYQPDVIVTDVQAAPAGVTVKGYGRTDRAPFAAEVGRVYLAAGVIPTAQILLRSLALYDRTVFMKDSQYFLLPLASPRGIGDVRRERLHTLSQLFLEIDDARISPYTVHLQVYSYNDLIGQAIGNLLGPLRRRLDFLARALESRLLIVQGYLHSAHSSQIAVTLKQGTAGQPDRLRLEARPSRQTRPMIRRILGKLLRHGGQLGAWPLPPMLQVAEAGRGFHCGGTFPMRRQPGALETDLLGRPAGWERLHLVDASVLPSIPATTITFSAMANAHRIGWEAATLA